MEGGAAPAWGFSICLACGGTSNHGIAPRILSSRDVRGSSFAEAFGKEKSGFRDVGRPWDRSGAVRAIECCWPRVQGTSKG